MQSLRIAFRDYLLRLNLEEPIELGGGGHSEPDEKDSDFLRERTRVIVKRNTFLLYLMVILLCLIFLAELAAAFLIPFTPFVMGLVLSGSFGTFIAIVSFLRRLWYEKFILDQTAAILDGLSPKDAAKFIYLLYTRFKNR